MSAVASASSMVAEPAVAPMVADPANEAAIEQLSQLPATDLASMIDQLSRIHPSEFAKLLSRCAAKADDDGDDGGDGGDDCDVDDGVDSDYEDDRDAVSADIEAYTAMYGKLSTQ